MALERLRLARRRARHRFRPRRAAEAVELVGGPGFSLLTTGRARWPWRQRWPRRPQRAPRRAGTLPPLAAAATRGAAAGRRARVALGGGRVVDVAKAVAAARGTGTRARPCPTTLSGAELTRVHRHAEGVDDATPRVRCALVVADSALAASQPEEELAASALNALAHAAEAPCTVGANRSRRSRRTTPRAARRGADGPASRTGTRRARGAARGLRDGLDGLRAAPRARADPSCSAAGPARGRERRAAPAHAAGPRPARAAAARARSRTSSAGAARGRRAPVPAHGRDAAARPGGHGGGPRRVRRTPRRRAAARPHAAARGPGGDPRALRRRLVTASGRAALRARTGTTIL